MNLKKQNRITIDDLFATEEFDGLVKNSLEQTIAEAVARLTMQTVTSFMKGEEFSRILSEHILENIRQPEDGIDADEQMIIEEVLKRIPKPKDGKNADEEKVIKAILSKLPKPKEIKIDEEKIIKTVLSRIKIRDGKTPVKGVDYFTETELKDLVNKLAEKVEIPTVEDIVSQINKLPIEPEKQIDISHIKGFSKRDGAKLGAGISRGGLKLIWNTVLEGSVNGSNTIFAIPTSLPSPVDNRYLVEARGTIKSVDGGDFSISGDNRTITFVSAPPNGSNPPRIILYNAH